MFSKILIANRGEIAVRIARTCARLGIASAAVYSDADRDALHVRACNEAHYIGPAPASESYLCGDRIIDVARKSGSEAIHPGYGFLSESAKFAQAVTDAELVWIGPSPDAIALMGSKIESKRLAEKSGVPVVPGYLGADQTDAALLAAAQRTGYPLLIKASAGGGGKGMRVVEQASGFQAAVEAARREALAAFGEGTLLLEKYLTEPRHIEVQVLGDNFGHLVHLGERECSIQRRHQKVAEESPSPAISPETRRRMSSSAVALARAASYSNAGTIEFIYQDGEYFFLEMNTRLQVEHPVTEMVTGLDIVEVQIRVAAGEPLGFSQDDVEFQGHSMEARLYAEDPAHDFVPSTGRITLLDSPHEPEDVRIDAGVSLGDSITPYYDPMIAKIITFGDSRQAALVRMREVLGGLELSGVTTNLDFLRWLFSHPQFELGNLSTSFIGKYYRPGAFALVPVQVAIAGTLLRTVFTGALDIRGLPLNPFFATPWRHGRQQMSTRLVLDGHEYACLVDEEGGEGDGWKVTVSQGDNVLYNGHVGAQRTRGGASVESFDELPSSLQLRLEGDEAVYSLEYGTGTGPDDFYVVWDSREYWVRTAPPLSTERLNTAVHVANEDTLESPMPGKVLKVLVAEGDPVSEDQALVIIEAMKMEFTIRAPHDGSVVRVHFAEGDQVAVGDVLVELAE